MNNNGFQLDSYINGLFHINLPYCWNKRGVVKEFGIVQYEKIYQYSVLHTVMNIASSCSVVLRFLDIVNNDIVQSTFTEDLLHSTL